MTDHSIAADERPIPSQAEGEVEPGVLATGERPVPSQAEGDLETVEQDLAEKSKTAPDSK